MRHRLPSARRSMKASRPYSSWKLLYLLTLSRFLSSPFALDHKGVASSWGNPIFLTDRGYADALCSDGTSAAFYYRAAAVPIATSAALAKHPLTVVYLQGGFWCWDDASCALRWGYWDDPSAQKQWRGKHLMSSKTLDNITLNGNLPTGLFEQSSRNAFAHAHAYYVPYCSSDAWLGSTRGEPADAFHFRGRDIVEAVIREVQRTWRAAPLVPMAAPMGTRGSTTQRRVILAGTSAGGLGTIHNVNFVSLLLPNVAVFGMPDGGWFMDVTPSGACAAASKEMWDCVEEGKATPQQPIALRTQFEAAWKYWNLSAVSPPIATLACASPQSPEPPQHEPSHPQAQTQTQGGSSGRGRRSRATKSWQCLFPAAALSLVQTPLFAVQSLTDSWQLQWNGGLLHAAPIASTLRSAAVEQLDALARAPQKSAVFGSICWVHGQLTTSSFFDVGVGGRSAHGIAERLVLNVVGGGGDSLPVWGANESAIENGARCDGKWNCSANCPANSG